MPTHHYSVFAKIYPDGSDAEKALELVLDSQLSDYHNSFIHVELKARDATPENNSGSDRSKEEETERWYRCGYYELSLQRLPTEVEQGWRVGRGTSRTQGKNRDVDILVICPGKRTKGVAPIHALVRFHPRSGVLMIVGVLDESPLQYDTTDRASPFVLGQGQKHVLYQPRNRIKIGSLSYNIVYENFDDTAYERYRAGRDNLLEEIGYSPPHAALSAIPRNQDAKKGPVVLHGTMSRGGFGWIFAAVNAEDGEPLAVKEHRIKDKECKSDVEREIKIGSSFLGLAALHKAGIIHRDVHHGNLLIMSFQPPRAVIHDFGKAIQAKAARGNCLGPVMTRAPEVDGYAYTNAIDIWSFAFACCCSILPQVQKDIVSNRRNRNPIDKDLYARIKIHLSTYSERGEIERLLADLLNQMLEWNPRKRISAAGALQHECMQEKAAEQGSYVQDSAQWKTSLASSESVTSQSPQANNWLQFHDRQAKAAAGQTNPLMKRQRLRN
ncbi:MAG: hypothetical protein Q9173_003775 [Seirophora scorigena]